MPVTSSSSLLKRWPNAERVVAAGGQWAQQLADREPTVLSVGYLGSYARGDAGVGSDLDLIVVRRNGSPIPDVLGADVASLPVPADVFHYTAGELARVFAREGRMAGVLRSEAHWWIPSPEELPTQ